MSNRAPRPPKPKPKPKPKPGRHFTPFYSAAEEATTKMEQENCDKDGGHASSTRGCIVYTPAADLPYKVLLIHHGRGDTEHAFATMREAEAFIRRNTPVPAAALSTLYDRDAD